MKRVLVLATIGMLALGACSSDGGDDTGAAGTEAVAVETASEEAAVTEATATEAAASEVAAAAAGTAAECAEGKTIADGTLTIATGDPAFPPYVIDNKPEGGQGFEAAVASAVARELGFDAAKTKWVRTAFDAAIAPGPKDFDFNLQQYTITDERKQAVDFSDGYYTASQALFGLADSVAGNAKSVADLANLKIGAAAGTTSVTYVEETIKPKAAIQVFNDNAAAKVALESKQIDAIMADLPTALYITAVEIEGTKVFGQIAGSGTDEFGMLLAKDNPLTACVNQALASLKSSGELDQITTKWMSEYTSAPTIS